jgi:tetratricopeptide (TPR) repeat protein
MGRARIADGDREEGVVLLQRALDLARRLDNKEMFFTAGWQVIRSGFTPEGWRKTVPLAHELLAGPLAGASPRTQGQALEFSGVALLAADEREGAEHAWRQLEELAQRSRDPFNRLNSLSYQGLLATMDGELDAAVSIGERTRQLATELGTPRLGAGFAFSRAGGRALLYLGRFDDFAAWFEAGARWQPEAALHLPSVGRPEQAKQALDEQWTGWRLNEGGGRHVQWESLACLLSLALAVEDHARVRVLAGLLADGPSISVAMLACCLPRLVGEAWLLLDEPDKARDSYKRALDVCTSTRFRPELALTHLQLAELLLDHFPSEAAEAQDHFNFAIEEFRAMKMQPSLERALSHKGLLKA